MIMDRTFKLPKPTPDQSAYLKRITDHQAKGYDPKVMVGGPNGHYACKMPPGYCGCPQDVRHKCANSHWVDTRAAVGQLTSEEKP